MQRMYHLQNGFQTRAYMKLPTPNLKEFAKDISSLHNVLKSKIFFNFLDGCSLTYSPIVLVPKALKFFS